MSTIDTTTGWDNADHDPVSIRNEHSGQLSTAASLEFAHADIHDAQAAGDDAERRTGYALSARDHAVAVLLAGDVTATQRRLAEHCLAAAEAFIATS